MSTKKTKLGLELESGAWQRFERAVEVVAKSPPQHRTAKSTAKKQRHIRRISKPKA
jgi:hypothetical protein